MAQPRKPASLQQADEEVLTWAAQSLAETPGRVRPNLGPPVDPRAETGVSLYLLELAEAPPLRGPERAPLQLEARYLVTATADDAVQAHTLLDALIFAAMRHPIYTVDLTSLSSELWRAFEVIPQPAFVLCVPVVVEQPMPAIPIVREPPTVAGMPMVTLRGVLVGPGAVPLANARVEYPPLNRTTTTNSRGEFNLHGLPAEPSTKPLRIRVKGKSFELPVEPVTGTDEAVIVRVPLLD